MSERLDELIVRYPTLEVCREQITDAFENLRDTFKAGGKLLVCGNGGSAADSDHLSAELLKGFGQMRPLDSNWHEKLGPALASKLQGALPVIPLPAFNALLSAFANDCDPEYQYAQLTWGLGKPDDSLLCISTSGNSSNVLHAARVAAACGLKTIGLSGESGGKLVDCVNSCIRVPETEVYKIQEYHLPIYHCLCFMLEDEFFA